MSRVGKVSVAQGFTLIELTLAMAFISALLLAIALAVIQMSQTYNKGIVLKEVNQAARDINDTLRRSVADTSSVNVSRDYIANDTGGRLCLGNYSYIWNTAAGLEADNPSVTTFEINMAAGWNDDTVLRLIRVEDTARLYCATNPASGALLQRTIRAEDAAKTDILLQTGEHTVEVLAFTVYPATESPTDRAFDTTTGERLITVTYRLGSGSITAMEPNQTACLPPSNPNSDSAYCTVQEFTIALRAGSGVN